MPVSFLAVGVTVFLPRGLWGMLSADGGIRFFPVGYHLVLPEPRVEPWSRRCPRGRRPRDRVTGTRLGPVAGFR